MGSASLAGAAHLPFSEIEDRSDPEQKIHPQDTLDLKAVVHRADFDIKLLDPQIADREDIDPLGENELSASDATNAMYRVPALETHANVEEPISGENRPSRAGVEQHVGEFGPSAAIDELRPHER